MLEKKTITLESVLYFLAFGLALAFRLIGLDGLPFNEAEAGWAWQAFQVSEGTPVQIGSQPAYVLLTSVFFSLFNSSEALARLLPALAGSAVVLLPFVLRDKIGQTAALAAAFGLALDPLLVAISRQAGSSMLALGFAVLAFASWKLAKPGVLGIFSALFLLSGQNALLAIFSVFIALLFLTINGDRPRLEIDPAARKSFLVAGGITLLLVGTLGMRYPLGLSAMLQAVPDYFSGWIAAPGFWGQVPFVQALLALPIYQPLALFFGGIAIIQRKTWQRQTTRHAAVLVFTILLLTLLNPSRQVSDLIWVLLPLWLLAGLALAPFLSQKGDQFSKVVWAQAMISMLLLTFWWANVIRISRIYFVNIPQGFKLIDLPTLDLGTKDYLSRMIVVVIVPLAIMLMTVVVVTAWSKRTALRGAVFGVGGFVGIYLIVTLFGINDLRPQQANELWSPVMASGYADDLQAALAELSEPSTGTRFDIETVYQVDSPLLHWQLRNMPNARYAPVLLSTDSPAVIINTTFDMDELGRPNAYRGEKIALQLYRNWGDRALPLDFDRWFIYREAPLEKQWVVVWAREDIFIGYQDTPDQIDPDAVE
ncbi:MAG: hypothetical protein ABFS17_02430 [Chloroflexota bacterium]